MDKWIKLLILGVLLSLNTNRVSAETILHAFNWNYAEVELQAHWIKTLGYDAVLVSSPILSDPSTEWWGREQPVDYRIMFGPLGDKQTFRNMSRALHYQGINLYVDVNLYNMNLDANHYRRSPGFNVDQEPYLSNQLFGNLGLNLFESKHFEPDCPSGQYCSLELKTPVLLSNRTDSASLYVLEAQLAYIRALKSLGVEGVRVLNAGLMDKDRFSDIFNQSTLYGLKVLADIPATTESQVIEQVIPFIQQQDGRIRTIDYAYLMQLKQFFEGERDITELPYAAGTGYPSVRLLVPSLFAMKNQDALFSPFLEKLVYAFVFATSNEDILVYSDHSENINSLHRWHDYYERDGVASMLQFSKAVKGSKISYLAITDCLIAINREGIGFAVLNRCSTNAQITITTGTLKLGLYTDLMSNNAFINDGSDLFLDLAPFQSKLYLHDPDYLPTIYFSGTPNDWQAEPMLFQQNGIYPIRKDFADGNGWEQPAFKVRTSDNDWEQAYPTENYVVEPFTTYQINFDPVSKTINAEVVADDSNAYCPVTFTCDNGHTSWGDSVYVTGDVVSLNNWQTKNAIKLEPTNYPTWQGTINIPKNTQVSWKCIIRQEDSPFTVRQWEQDPNNNFNTGNCDVTQAQGSF